MALFTKASRSYPASRLRPCLIGLACLLIASVAGAQGVMPTAPSESTRFLPGYNFHISVEGLSGDDPRFAWDTHVGGDLDLVEYPHGRINVLVDYEAVLGHQLRPFDPNQGNYTLEASASIRARRTEFAGVFHHVSRHLSDRPKAFSVDWNMIGARALRRRATGPWVIDVQAGVAGVLNHHYADYRWGGDFDVRIRRRVTGTVGIFANTSGNVVGTDGALPGRDTEMGARVEAGLRLTGDAAAIELFCGFERRADAYPLDPVPQRWALAGIRFVNR